MDDASGVWQMVDVCVEKYKAPAYRECADQNAHIHTIRIELIELQLPQLNTRKW